MTRSLLINVTGLPGAQGSKRHVGGGVMVESSKKAAPWRQDVIAAAESAIADAENFTTFAGAVVVRAHFRFTRPKAHFRTGANAGILRPNAPDFVTKSPDIDKLLRSTFDALTIAGVWRDDSLACRVLTDKTWSMSSGVALEIKELLP